MDDIPRQANPHVSLAFSLQDTGRLSIKCLIHSKAQVSNPKQAVVCMLEATAAIMKVGVFFLLRDSFSLDFLK